MTERHLHLLSPYRPPTSYPVSLSADEAAAWLNAHAALWHPLALLGASLPPRPASAYDHNDPASGCVYALASGPSLFLPDDWRRRATEAGALVFDATADRGATDAALKDALKHDAFDVIDAAVVRAFAGIGFGYLMLDTLFDAANHDRLLDGQAFWNDVQAAATAALEQRREDAFAKLTDAAAKLKAAREGLALNGVAIVEIVIREGTNWSTPWPRAFHAQRPLTLVATAKDLLTLPDRTLQDAPPGSIAFAIGAMTERSDTLLPIESQVWSLQSARRTVREVLGVEPKLYARPRAEYHASLPSWLNAAGYTGCLLLNLDGVTLPSRYSSIIQWPGPDGRSVNAYTRDPLPAHDSGTFFNLAYHLHEATSRDSQPTFALAHTSPAGVGYDDFLALAELDAVFGDFTGLEKLLGDSHSADYVSVSSPDDFFIDTLDHLVTKQEAKDPVSRFARHWRTRRVFDSAFALAALHRMLTAPDDATLAKQTELEQAEAAFEMGTAETAPVVLEKAFASLLAERLLARSAPNMPGWLVLNPAGSMRRVGLEIGDGVIPIEGPVKASEPGKVVVEVPGLGYAWIPRGVSHTPTTKPKLRTADSTTVRNEFLEAELDPATGAIKGIRDSRFRVTRLGQILVWRPGSRMVANSVRVTHAGAAMGEVTATGEILDDAGSVIAKFTQRVRAWMGRPALEVRIALHPAVPIVGYPWHSYLGCRFAWRDDRAQLYRGSEGFFNVTSSQHPNSGDGVEVRFGKERSFVFTGGLPFLKREGGRMLDVVLVTAGETATTFDLTIAFDRDYPMPTASTWTHVLPVLEVNQGPPLSGASGWLGNFDLPSLLLTSLRPATPGEGMSRAVTARVIETAGYAFTTDFRFARDSAKASSVDLNGEVLRPLTMTADAVTLDGSAHELASVKFEW